MRIILFKSKVCFEKFNLKSASPLLHVQVDGDGGGVTPQKRISIFSRNIACIVQCTGNKPV